jgi:hypothetical protein
MGRSRQHHCRAHSHRRDFASCAGPAVELRREFSGSIRMQKYFHCFRLIGSERGDRPVSIAELSRAEREYFKQVSGLSWLGQTRVLISPTRVGVGGATGSVVIAACERPFDNVPRRMFGKAPLTHAIGYADGSTGLISVDEFQRLDLSGFVDVRSIQGAKVETGGPANGSQPFRGETNRTSPAPGPRP